MSHSPRTRRQSQPVSSSSTAPASPLSPSSRATCHCTALRLCVCFPPASASTAAMGLDPPRYGDTQIINIAFDHDFVPTPDVHLSLHVRRRGPAGLVYGPINALPRITSFDLCNIEQIIHLDPVTDPDASIVVKPEPGLHSSEPEEYHYNQRPSSSFPCPSATCVSLLLGAVSLALALALFLFRTMHQTAPHTPCTQCLTVPPALQDFTVTKPSPLCRTKRASPLPLFDDLVALIVRRANTLLPLTVSAQNVIDQHYSAHSHPSRNSSSSDQRFDTPITVFFVHLLHATNDLCDAATHWTVLSKSPIAEDISLLCTAIFRSVVNLPVLWAETSSIMASPLSYTSVTAISTFLKALERFVDVDTYASHDVNAGCTDGENDAGRTLEGPCFYNGTSYAMLKSLEETFFVGDRSSTAGDLSRFSEVVHDAMHMTGSLERETSDLLRQLTLLSNIVRDTLIPALRAQPREKKATSWFSRLPPQPTRRNHAAEYALADIAPRHEDLLPLISTTTTLTWIVGFAYQQLKHVTRDMERLGNQTSGLVAVPPPPTCACSSAASNSSPAAEEAWWHGMPWVTATRDSTSKYGAACTFWFLPSANDIARSFKDLLVWSAQEADRNELDYQWLCQAEQAWKW